MTKLPSHIFRGYDIRGLVGSELNNETVELIGKAYATWLLKRRIYDCVVGYDCRLSSPEFSEIIIKALTDSGITVYDIGLTLSQIAYFAQYYFRTRGMMMITASHNPKEYNGFKLGTGFSETMLTEDIVEFSKLIESGDFMTNPTPGKRITYDIKKDYFADILRHFDGKVSYKVVVDSCGATTGAFLPELLREAGCTVIEQNTTPDGNFPVGTPDPTERDVQERLAKRVVEEGADLGFSYDCDGDRMGVVDAQGNLIWNDTLVSLYSIDVLDYLPGSKIVYNTLCSKQVDEVIRNNAGIPIMWITGHSWLKAKIREEHSPFCGEVSGHFFFVDNFYGHDDGAYASIRLLHFLKRKNLKLHEVIAQLPQYVSSPEIKIGCPEDVKFELIRTVITDKLKAEFPQAKVSEFDGIRVDTENEMCIIRASQNGPYLTVKYEAKSEEKFEEMRKMLGDFLKSLPEIDFASGVNTHAL